MIINNEIAAIIGADYDEHKPETLRSFTMSLSGHNVRDSVTIFARDERLTFATLDEAAALASEIADTVYFSSTLDNYFQDIGEPNPLKQA